MKLQVDIEIFRTTVESSQEADLIRHELEELFPGSKVNFDLEDCDKIMRVRDGSRYQESIVKYMKNRNLECTNLP